MGKIAFLFSGQGDQFPGMGKTLYENSPAAKVVFDKCEAHRPGTIAQCFSGTEDELKQTVNAQPCLYAMELAAVRMLEERGIHPAMAAGFSLGEIAAAAAAGVYDTETGFRLVCRRGVLMQSAAEAVDASMAAVVKLSDETVRALCARFENVFPVNYNCPGQVTVSGVSENMPAFCQAVKEAGGRAIPLKVGGGFHSPFMKEASEAFGEALAKEELHTPSIPLYADLTGEHYGDDLVPTLSKQICSPVLWEKAVRAMIADGAEIFLEIGPGKTLTNMMKKIDPEAKAFAVCELETWISEVIPS
ncbi:MAG: ACP S-malonyltransferase [Clostridia bacterium]|nr:ACP S-malonyltransferase [Clostridia bacterium]